MQIKIISSGAELQHRFIANQKLATDQEIHKKFLDVPTEQWCANFFEGRPISDNLKILRAS